MCTVVIILAGKKETATKEEKPPPQVIHNNTCISGDTCRCRPNCTGKPSHVILKQAKKIAIYCVVIFFA